MLNNLMLYLSILIQNDVKSPFRHMESHHSKLYTWLCKSGLLEKCKNQIEVSKSLHRINLDIDTLTLLEFDSYIGNCLIGNFQLFSKISQEVLYEAFKDTITSINQISCVVRPSPTILTGKQDSKISVDSTALVNYHGTIVSVDDPVSYTRSTKYTCSVETCQGADASSHIRVYTHASRECDVINPNLQCTVCMQPLYEDVSKRALGRRMIIYLELHEARENTTNYFVKQTLTVIVRDELLEKVTLGNRVAVVGLQLSRSNYSTSIKSTLVEAFNIVPIVNPRPNLLPKSMREINSVRETSPWQLLPLLGFCITPKSVPQGAFHTLKQLLLLSLIRSECVTDTNSPLYLPTAHPKHSPALNILVVIRDTRLLRLVFDHFASMSAVSLLRSEHPLCGIREANSLHVGQFLLASGGVAIINEVSSLKKDDKVVLTSTLQNRAVIIGKKKSEIFPLTCNIWGSQCESVKKPTIFPFDVTYRITKEFDDNIMMNEIIDSDIEKDEEFVNVSIEDVKSYLTLASSITVEFDNGCTTLLAGYCQAAKSVRYGSGCELPVNSLYSLHLLAANHAKINFRSVVLDVDAVFAVKVYEECLHSYQGYSTVDLQPTTHIIPSEVEQSLNDNIDKDMELFYSKLVQFCQTHIPGFQVDLED